MNIAFVDATLGGVTSTFLLRELLELQRTGVRFEVFTHQNPAGVVNERRGELRCKVHALRPIRPLRIATAHLSSFIRRPRRYLKCCLLAATLPVSGIRNRARTVGHFTIAMGWARDLERGRFDRVHSLWASGPGSTGYFLATFLDRPFSFSCHAADIFADRLFLEEKIRLADRIVTCTEFNHRFLMDRYPLAIADKIRVCHHGLPLERFPETDIDRRPLAPSQDRPLRLLAVGQLQPKKGFATLIETIGHLTATALPIRLSIVGEGPERKNLLLQVRNRQLEDNVVLLGSLPFSAVLEQYRLADAFVMPSVQAATKDMDGIPNVVLEAMAQGVPVIATDLSGIPEVVVPNETGRLVASGSSKALAEAISDLIAQPKLTREMAVTARRRVLEHFDLKKTCRRLHDVLTSPIGSGTKPRICFVAPNLGLLLNSTEEKPFAGGAEVQQFLLATQLQNESFEVFVIVRGDDGHGVETHTGLTLVKAARLGEGRKPFRAIHPQATRLLKAMRQIDADVYWTRGAKVETAVVAAFCRRHGKKYVHALAHDDDCSEATPSGLGTWWKRKAYGFAIRSADVILAQTHQQVALFRKGFGRTAQVVPNLMPEAEETTAGIDHNLVLWVGAIKPFKRPHLFLDLAEALPDAEFRMIGFGKKEDPASFEYYREIRERAEALGNVEFAGFVPFLEIDRHYADAALLVNTSIREGYPNVHLQAYRFAVPVVTVCDPDGALRTHDLGTFVENPAELPKAVSDFLRDPALRAQAGQNAKRYIHSHHSPSLVVPQILGLLSQLTGSAVPQPPSGLESAPSSVNVRQTHTYKGYTVPEQASVGIAPREGKTPDVARLEPQVDKE